MVTLMANTHAIFVNAEAWRATAHILYQQLRHDRMQFVGPAIASAAFSLELYFKTIYEMDSVPIRPRVHNLLVLFQNLSPQRRRQIQERYDAATGSMQQLIKKTTGKDHGIEKVLEDARDIYEIMRYIHEGGRPGITWNADPVLNAVRAVILEENPDWSASSGPRPTSPAR